MPPAFPWSSAQINDRVTTTDGVAVSSVPVKFCCVYKGRMRAFQQYSYSPGLNCAYFHCGTLLFQPVMLKLLTDTTFARGNAREDLIFADFKGLAWRELKGCIEAGRTCVACFLQRFFDGEGSIRGRELVLYNTDKGRLLYVQHLLWRYFGITATGPHRATKAGSTLRDPRTNKFYRRKKGCYYLYVVVRDLPKFHRYVGFTIKRKQRRLTKVVKNKFSPPIS